MGGVPALGLCDLNDRWSDPSAVHIVSERYGTHHAGTKIWLAETGSPAAAQRRSVKI
jgi:hypothetical protein